MSLLNVVLDIDNTIVSTHPIDEYKYIPTRVKEEYSTIDIELDELKGKVFFRPFLKQFLDFLERRQDQYKVSIFTAGSSDYALFILQYVIQYLTPSLAVYHLFSYDHYITTIEHYSGPKDLRLLFEIDSTMNQTNTILIDDCIENIQTNQLNGLLISPFHILFNSYVPKDKELLDMIELLKERYQQLLKNQYDLRHNELKVDIDE